MTLKHGSSKKKLLLYLPETLTLTPTRTRHIVKLLLDAFIIFSQMETASSAILYQRTQSNNLRFLQRASAFNRVVAYTIIIYVISSATLF
jgi:hypothetical protein